jgi:hypothetical protein
MNLRRFMPAPTRSGDRILTAQLIAWLGHRDIGQCLSWVKLRNTQQEQISSDLPPRTDVGLAGPKTLRGADVTERRAGIRLGPIWMPWAKRSSA